MIYFLIILLLILMSGILSSLFSVKNILIRSFGLICFIILPILVFSGFIELTGEPRKLLYDIIRDTPEKIEVISTMPGDGVLFLWLHSGIQPVYYVIEDKDGSKSKEAKQKEAQAKQKGAKLYFNLKKGLYLEGKSKSPDTSEEESGNNEEDLFEVSSPIDSGPRPEKSEEIDDQINIIEENNIPRDRRDISDFEGP